MFRISSDLTFSTTIKASIARSAKTLVARISQRSVVQSRSEDGHHGHLSSDMNVVGVSFTNAQEFLNLCGRGLNFIFPKEFMELTSAWCLGNP